MKIIVALLVLLDSACTTVRIPPCKVVNQWGIARASTPESAEKLSASISSVAPRVLAAVPGLDRKTLDVRLLPRVSSYRRFAVDGASIQRPTGAWIEVGENDRREQEEAVLAHELVHFWLGPDWIPLPPAMEDGLANLVEGTLMPDSFVRDRLHYVVAMCCMMSGAFQIDSYGAAVGRRNVPLTFSVRLSAASGRIPRIREILAMNDAAYESEGDNVRFFTMVSCGYLLASRIGIERLHALCLRAKWEGRDLIPPDWILEAAGLVNADLPSWSDAILELYGRSEQEELLHHSPWIDSSHSEIHSSSGLRLEERD